MIDITDKIDGAPAPDGQLPASEYNDHKNELQLSVQKTGQTLNVAITDQLSMAHYINGGGAGSCAVGGTADAVELTPVTGPGGLVVPDAYASMDGLILTFYQSAANTITNPTINFGQTSGTLLGAKTIVDDAGAALAIGRLFGTCSIKWDQGNDRWILMRSNVGVFSALNVAGAVSIGGDLTVDDIIKTSSLTINLNANIDAAGAAENALVQVNRDTNTTGFNGFRVAIANGTSTYNHFLRGSGGDSFLCGNNGRAIIGADALPASSLACKLFVRDSTELGSVAGDNIPIFGISGEVANSMTLNHWHRRESAGSTFATASFISGIQVDSSFNTPETSKAWYKRFVNTGNEYQAWGNGATEWMRIEASGLTRQAGTSAKVKEIVIDIGDWNMDTTTNISVAHGLSDFTKIRSINVIIRDDADGLYSDLAGTAISGVGGSADATSTNISLSRQTTNSRFDSANYSSTSYNRGWIYITYEV